MAILQNQITQQPSFFDGMDDDIPDQNEADVKTGTSFFDGMDDEEPEDKDVDNKLIIPPHLDPNNFNQGVQIPPVEMEVDEIDDEPFVLFRNVKKGKEEVNQAYLQTFSPLVENNEQLLKLFKDMHPEETEDNKVSFVKYVFNELHDFEKGKYQDEINLQKGRIPLNQVKSPMDLVKNVGIANKAGLNLITGGYYAELIYDTTRLISEDLPEAYAKYSGSFRDLLEMVGYAIDSTLSVPIADPASGEVEENRITIDPEDFADGVIDFLGESFESSIIFGANPINTAQKLVLSRGAYGNKIQRVALEAKIDNILKNPKFIERLNKNTSLLKGDTKKLIANRMIEHKKAVARLAEVSKNMNMKFNISGSTPDYMKILGANQKVKNEILESNAKIAKENRDIQTKFIEQFENNLLVNRRQDSDGTIYTMSRVFTEQDKKLGRIPEGKNVGDVNEEFISISVMQGGFRTIDLDKVKEIGSEVLSAANVENVQDVPQLLFFRRISDSIDEGFLTNPILNPDKLNGLVSLVTRLKEKGVKFDANKTFSQNLFELTIKKDLKLDTGDLLEELTKSGLSFEDYMTAVVTSGTEAATLMNKLSQMSKKMQTYTFNKAGGEKAEQILEEQKYWKSLTGSDSFYSALNNFSIRFESARRGILVSQIPTAIRNFESVFGAAPVNSVSNLVDTMIFQMGQAMKNEKGFVNKTWGTTKGFFSISPLKLDDVKNIKNPNIINNITGKGITWTDNWIGSTESLRNMFNFRGQKNIDLTLRYFFQEANRMDDYNRLMDSLNDIQRVRRNTKIKKIPEKYTLKDKLYGNIPPGKKVGDTTGNMRYVEVGAEFDNSSTAKTIISGASTATDKVLNTFEDMVWGLNFLNRWQEHHTRRSIGYGELSRQLRNKWGIDLTEAIERGELLDIVNDVNKSSVTGKVLRPEGAASISEIIDIAVEKALKGTYSAPPDNKILKSLERFIVNVDPLGNVLSLGASISGFVKGDKKGQVISTPLKGTAILPFPRFILSQMELSAQHTAGGATAVGNLVRKLIYKGVLGREKLAQYYTSADKKKGLIPEGKKVGDLKKLGIGEDMFSERDRDLIAKNLVGFSVLAGACEYRMSKDAPSEYYMLPNPINDKQAINLTPLHPLRPVMFLGEMCAMYRQSGNIEVKKDNVKNLSEHDQREAYHQAGYDRISQYMFQERGFKELLQTFFGSSLRMGVGNDIVTSVEGFFQNIQAELGEEGFNDLLLSERGNKLMSTFLGNYTQTFATTLNQYVDLQRSTGMRTEMYKENAPEITLDPAINSNNYFYRPYLKYKDVWQEKNLENKMFLFDSDFQRITREDGEIIVTEEGLKRRETPLSKFVGLTIETAETDDQKFFRDLGFIDYTILSKQFSKKGKKFEIQLLRKEIPKVRYYAESYLNGLIDSGEYSETVARTKTKALIQAAFIGLRNNTAYKDITGNAMSENELRYNIYRVIPKKHREIAMYEWMLANSDTKARRFDYTNNNHIDQLIAQGLFSAFQAGELSEKLIKDTVVALKDAKISKSKLTKIKEQMKKAFSVDD